MKPILVQTYDFLIKSEWLIGSFVFAYLPDQTLWNFNRFLISLVHKDIEFQSS